MYTEEMLESIKKVEASRTSRIGKELRRMDADEKDNLLKEFHPDYKESGFATLKMGPNKGEKAPAELADLLQANSRVLGKDIDLTHPDYDVDVLVIGGGGAGASAAIEAHNGGANVMIVTKLRQRERLSAETLSGCVRRRTFRCKAGAVIQTGYGSTGSHSVAERSGCYVR